jgi:hypothetical protein
MQDSALRSYTAPGYLNVCCGAFARCCPRTRSRACLQSPARWAVLVHRTKLSQNQVCRRGEGEQQPGAFWGATAAAPVQSFEDLRGAAPRPGGAEAVKTRGGLLPEQGILVAQAWTCRGRAAQALEEAKSSSLLFWGSRYHLFVSWSADRAHPWDALPAAGHYAMLEIGNHRGTDGQVQARDRRTSAPGQIMSADALRLSRRTRRCSQPARRVRAGLQNPDKEA